MPQTLIKFLDGAETAESFVFTVVRDRGRRTAQQLSRLRGIDARGYWLPPAPAKLTSDGSQVAAFSYQAYIGFVGVIVDYREGLQQSSFFDRNPSPIVQVTGAHPREVRAMMTTSLIRIRGKGRRTRD